MNFANGMKKAFLASVGAAATTAEVTKDIFEKMIEKGERTVEQGKVLNQELKHNAKQKVKEHVSVQVTKEYDKAFECVDEMSAEDLALLKERIAKAEALQKEKQEAAAAKMTTQVIAKDKNTWLIGFGHGFLWMTTIGLVSNFVTKLIMVGTAPTLAVTMLTVAAIVGIVGSYIWGWLDQKFGTKNASLIYGVWYLIALLLMIFQNGSMILIGLATFFVGFGIGGIGNLIPSIIGTCFGRFGFIQANRIIAPVNTAIRSTALVIIGIIGVEHLNTAYMVFFAFSVLAIILISFIKPKTYE